MKYAVNGLSVVCVKVSSVINEFFSVFRLEVYMVRVSSSFNELVFHWATYCCRKEVPTTT